MKQELRHCGHGTFFRSLGAILGFLPSAGSLVGKKNQNNFRFSPADTASIVAWINSHLFFRTVEGHLDQEPTCIAALHPLLNLKHNGAYTLVEVKQARKACRLRAITPVVLIADARQS